VADKPAGRRLSLVAGVAVGLLAAGGACAQEPAAPFFRGKQINMIVGSSAGGGYDIYARLIARHMSRYIPGNPAIMATNMPGAASNTAAAHIYNVAPKDGTVIGALQTAAVLDPLFGDSSRTKHDASKFVYLG
jgi:tripartite-type tricarboxylate transporter receptor subunit TctC